MADAIQTRSKNILILSLNLRSLCDESCLLCSVFLSGSETTSFCFKISNLKPKGLRGLY